MPERSSEREWVLLNPGPANTSWRVRQALVMPDLCHREPEFFEVMRECRARLVHAAGCAETFAAVLFTGSGTAAVEAVVSSVVPRDRSLLIVSNGVYGERLVRIAAAHGIATHVLTYELVAPVPARDVEAALRAHPEVSHVAIVHHETTTGLLNPVAEVARVAAGAGRRVLVDAMSSLFGEPLDVTADGIDFVMASANKCLQSVPGVSFVLGRRTALEALSGRPPRSVYLDLYNHYATQERDNTPFTPAVQVVYAMREALVELMQEGVPARIARYAENARVLRRGMAALGFEILVPEGARSHILTTFRLRPGVTYDALHDAMKRRGYIIYAGQGDIRTYAFRVSNMGTLTPRDMEGVVAAFAASLEELRGQTAGAGQAERGDTPRAEKRHSLPPATRRPRKALMFLIDGFDPAYVQPARMPRLAALMRAGASTLDGRGVLPSLTNVNHVSLLTGTYPERHGLSTNFYYDRATRTDVFMEQVSFVQEPLLFERLHAAGWSTALVTAKEKLTKLLRRGLDHCVDMKTYPEPHRAAVGAPPDIFTLAINLWVLRMAREVAIRQAPDFLYVATTDYPQHKLAPDEPAMQAYLAESDEALGTLLDVYDLRETLVILTADHGMNAKGRSVSPVRLLAEAGIRTHGVPLIRDGLFAHHRDLGGALYLYFDDPGAVRDARDLLRRAPGIDEVVTREEATRDRLPPERVGDLICWAGRDVALGIWGEGPASRLETGLRSHGSKHEQRIPMLIAGPGVREGVEIRDGRTVDLLPTLCHLVGVEAGHVQGRVLEEALA